MRTWRENPDGEENQQASKQIDREIFALKMQAENDIRHGVNCEKVAHAGTGYLHEADDDRPYDVDGLMYCGRCHTYLGEG